MQAYHIKLESPVSTSFRCQRAANSQDIDASKKSIHELKIEADLQSEYSIGLILGSSGSGKTTLAKGIFEPTCFEVNIKDELPIIEQLPKEWSFDQCSEALHGIGLTSVPCWIRPVYTLSNGQRARATALLQISENKSLTVIDEWTSVVDRTVAKVMSHCVAKFARKNNKKIVFLSCHYDVVEWLNPDWIIDCNTSKFIDRRLLHRARTEQLKFQVRECDSSSWKNFSRYHYLSDKLAGGKNHYFGLYHGQNQIGFIAFSNYVPIRKNTRPIFHANRIVIHPDYCGFGLGLRLTDIASKDLSEKYGYDIRIKFSSLPILKACQKNPKWKLLTVDRRSIGAVKRPGSSMLRKTGFRTNVTAYTFQYIS